MDESPTTTPPTNIDDTDELYVPYVPPRDQGDLDDDDEPVHIPTREELRPRTPPAGMNRRDRKDWKRNEAIRVAQLQDGVPHLWRRRDLPTGPPPGLGRAGRKAWRAENRDLKAQRRLREERRTAPERTVGSLVLAVAVAGVAVWWLLVDSDSTPAQPAPEPAPTFSAAPATAAPTTADNGVTATPPDTVVQALTAWVTATCSLPPQRWGQGVHALMTDLGWAQREQVPLVVDPTWSCSNIQVRAAARQPANGTWMMRWEADRQITLPNVPAATEHASGTRLVVPTDAGWRVDVIPGE